MTMTDDIYAAGYAIPDYDISERYEWWRFRGEHYKVPQHCISRHFRKEWPFGVAEIEDVRKAAIK